MNDAYVSWLRRLTAVLLLGIAVTAVAIAAGLFDPMPVGPVVDTITLSPQNVPAGGRQVVWLSTVAPPGDFSLRLTARWATGERDSRYGVTIGLPEAYTAITVSPLGYTAVTRHTPSPVSLLPFQPWPHVGTGSDANEIWVDWVGSRMTVRLNRELLWTGEIDLEGRDVGLVAESMGETAVINFQTLVIYAPEQQPPSD